jgi:carbon monoxide dehydrogenase subunit G
LIIDQNVTIPAPPQRVWDFMMDVPQVSTCVPGVERVEEISPDVYKGILGVKIGPVSVRLEGQVTLVERNRDDWLARMDIEATDRRIRGAVNAKAWMKLTPRDDGQTDMAIHTDASIFGKLGQFGQAVMKKKADQVVAEFAQNMSRKLSEPADAVTEAAVAEGGRETESVDGGG